jgi:hypothetical protein
MEMARAGKGQELKTWDLALENKKEHEHHSGEQVLDLTEPGAYLVTADGGGVHADALVLITKLAIVTKSAHDKTIAYAADALSGEPIGGADLQISSTRASTTSTTSSPARKAPTPSPPPTAAGGSPCSPASGSMATPTGPLIAPRKR